MTDDRSRATEVTIIPDGMPWDEYELHLFAVRVCWRGEPNDEGLGGWSIDHNGNSLGRDGKWEWSGREPNLRWKTFEEAFEVAKSVVNSRRLNGRTWQEWQDWRAEKEAQSED